VVNLTKSLILTSIWWSLIEIFYNTGYVGDKTYHWEGQLL